jgi:Uncharacterized conserved protein
VDNKQRKYGKGDIKTMAEIKAFKGLRFTEKAGKIEELTCPPYDIISEKERQEYLKINENNLIRLELPKDGEDPYKEAGKILESQINNNILKKDDKEGIYIYEEEFTANGKKQKIKGIVTLIKIEEFSKNVVLPHEETLSKAKTDRLNLIKATHTNFSQIYSLYMDEKNTVYNKIDECSKSAPIYDFDDGHEVVHRMWKIEDEDTINYIVKEFKDKKLYIADGHHRYETSINFRNYCRENNLNLGNNHNEDYVMMMLVNMENDGLVVFPTHRIVKNLKDFNAEQVLLKCSQYFDIEKYNSVDDMQELLNKKYDENKKAFAFYIKNNNWALLTLKSTDILKEMLPGLSDATIGLDVTVLHTLVLERLFGIDKANMANGVNLTYTKFAEEAMSEVDEDKAQCAFILNPTRVTEIRDVAAAGEKMPQKSTYFYPKVITGMVMNNLD